MKTQGLQDVSIEAIIKWHELGDITNRTAGVRSTILQSIKGNYIVGCFPLMDFRMVLLTLAVLLVISLNPCH